MGAVGLSVWNIKNGTQENYCNYYKFTIRLEDSKNKKLQNEHYNETEPW